MDAAKQKDFELTRLKTEELPPEMQKMNPEERKAYIAQQAKEREKLQQQINQLNAERETYVAQQRRVAAGSNTLDAVVISSVREQAEKRNFKFQ